MSRTIRHANRVTLPNAWFDGAQEVTSAPATTPKASALSNRAAKQRRVLAALTDDWQDIRKLSEATGWSETIVRTAANELCQRGFVQIRRERNGMGLKNLYTLTPDGRAEKELL